MSRYGNTGLMVAAMLSASLAVSNNAAAESVQYKVLFSFDGAGGAGPAAALLLDGNGNLYGTTQFGGNTGSGTVFKLELTGAETVLHSFDPSQNSDGAEPIAGLVADASGNLYGTTISGGTAGTGIVFKLAPNGNETVLHSFCSQPNCTDGANGSRGRPIVDGLGNLYDTANGGGGANGGGIVFKMAPNGAETVLHAFCAPCTDGAFPRGGLISDSQGSLYGTTSFGGPNYGGTLFRVARNGRETVLHSFCRRAGCVDGLYPQGNVVSDNSGNIYGTAYLGGAYGGGTIFRLAPSHALTVLHHFCSKDACADGALPEDGVVLDSEGNLYGTTYGGGTHGLGTVFRLAPDGTETVLYSFCSAASCADGMFPLTAGVIVSSQGKLYGTTAGGGARGLGTVFEITITP